MDSGYFNDEAKEYVITDMFPRRKWLNYLWDDTAVCACDQFGFGTAWSVINGKRREIEGGVRNLMLHGGVNALRDCGVIGLLGLFGTEDAPRTSYSRSWEDAGRARNGEIVRRDGVAFSGIDIILNNYSPEEISAFLRKISDRPFVKIMIHEQFFYPDWAYYEADFEKRIAAAIEILQANNYESVFFEEVL